jgi:hypothetical protein
MRIQALVLVVVALGVSASLAIAAPPAGKGKGKQTQSAATGETDGPAKGKKPVTGEGCRPRVTAVVKGALVGTPGDAATELTLAVEGANAHGKTLLAGGLAQLSFKLDEKTKVRRNGAKTVGSLADGDRVLVQARVCKADLKATTAPTLTAVRVVAHPAPA